MGSLYQSVTHCVSSLFWCKCHELSAYLVSYIAMMVREDELIGFSMLLNKHCYLLWCGQFIPTGWHWCQTHVNGQSCEYWSTNLVCSGKCQLTSWEYFPQSVRHWLCLGWTCIWATVEVLKISDFLKHFNSFSKISNYWGFIVWDLKYRYW